MSLDIKYLVFACYVVKCSSKVICKSLYSIFIYVLHSVTEELTLIFNHLDRI